MHTQLREYRQLLRGTNSAASVPVFTRLVTARLGSPLHFSEYGGPIMLCPEVFVSAVSGLAAVSDTFPQSRPGATGIRGLASNVHSMRRIIASQSKMSEAPS